MSKQVSWQREGEEILTVVRRHPLVIRKGLYILLLCSVIGCVPLLLFPLNPAMYLVLLAFIGIGGLCLFYYWVGWYFSVYIITNHRVRYISQKGLFGKSIIELPLGKIQNLSFSIKGFSGEIFKFGTIVLQTMVGDLVLDRVSEPETVYNILQDALSTNYTEEENDDI